MVVKVFVLLIIMVNGGTLQTITPAPKPFVELEDCHDAAVEWVQAHPTEEATLGRIEVPVQVLPAV